MRLGREKILLGSDGGNGKTTAWVSIAKALPRSKFIVIESDDGVTKIAQEQSVGYTPVNANMNVLPAGGPIYLFPTFQDWMDVYRSSQAIEKWIGAKLLGPDDFVITEGIDIMRSQVSGEYAEKTAGVWDKPERGLQPSSWNAFINKRNTKAPILEGSDYQAIDTEIYKVILYFAYQIPCNYIATTGTEGFRTGQYADDNLKAWYSSMGMPVRFSGHKDYPRKFDTLIVFGRSMSQGYTFQVFKDRGGQLRGQSPDKTIPPVLPHRNFYQDFLVNMAGWPQAIPVNGTNAPVPPPFLPVSVPPPPRIA